MEAWVQQAPDKPQRGFQEAVHIILESIEGLKDDDAGDLPDFEEAMTRVQGLYRSLPWK
ncbi:hypothetical protein [Hydrogenophaga sp. PBL-H3]|uniref:hypothetical protein n=1 Tax=Hydrogenophaga sp. PBL-H3 TaxID=434010 RepID=UPI00135CDB51|nr:hypothetical protein [Hydrogenophaga sp. PBL-H3]